MKTLIPYILLLSIILISCSKDDDSNTDEPNSEPTTSVEEPVITVTETCLLSDFDIQENSTVTINCLLDLEGQTVTIPSGVTFEFDGGDVFNGTLNFASLGKIDGELLNSKLIIEGDIELTNEVFNFNPGRWNIIEGEVSSDIAESNKNNLNNLLEMLPEFYTDLGENKRVNFEINKLDAFFKVDGFSENGLESVNQGIIIPSNYNLILSDETFFRVYPNDGIIPTLIYVGVKVGDIPGNEKENITITGGNFIGDRDTHNYSNSESTYEWGHLMRITGASNVTVSNATFIDAMGDGINVNGHGHSFDPWHIPSNNVHINNNIFKRNRRNQISITAGNDIYVEENEFIDASIHTDKSNGVAPGFAIDVEATETEIAENIFIRNNIETSSRIGSFTIHTGDFVTIENNEVERFISYTNTRGSSITDNKITAVPDIDKSNGTAIVAGRTDRYDSNYDNTVTGNLITGYAIGIVVTNVDVLVADNEIIDCNSGIVLEDLKRAIIKDNIIRSTLETSTGISSGAAATFIDDVEITQTEKTITLIDVKRDPFKFININKETAYENYSFTIKGTVTTSPATSNFVSNGIVFKNNIILEGGIRLINAARNIITENEITTTTANSIRIDAGCSDISITNNNLITSQSCVFENNTDSVNITLENNTCN